MEIMQGIYNLLNVEMQLILVNSYFSWFGYIGLLCLFLVMLNNFVRGV
jgi:hypothetical protein